jgi:hypothetical protein
MRSLVSLHEKYIFTETDFSANSFIIIIIALYVSNSSTLKSFFFTVLRFCLAFSADTLIFSSFFSKTNVSF